MAHCILKDFILFVLLNEGKSFLAYKFLCFIKGDRIANRLFFKRLFCNCDISSYNHYSDIFYQNSGNKISDVIEVFINDNNLMTGEFSYR